MTKQSVILKNCADWHERSAKQTRDPFDRQRHELIAEDLYFRADRQRMAEERA
jgi:hypothetical protein